MPFQRHRRPHLKSTIDFSIKNEAVKTDKPADGKVTKPPGIIFVEEQGGFHANTLDLVFTNTGKEDIKFTGGGSKFTVDLSSILAGCPPEIHRKMRVKINGKVFPVADWVVNDPKGHTEIQSTYQFLFTGTELTWPAGKTFTLTLDDFSVGKDFKQGIFSVEFNDLINLDSYKVTQPLFAKRVPASRGELNILPAFVPKADKPGDVVYITDPDQADINNVLTLELNHQGSGPAIKGGKVNISLEAGSGPGDIAPNNTVAGYKMKVTENYGNDWGQPSAPSASKYETDELLGWTFHPKGEMLPQGANGKIRLELSQVRTMLGEGTANMYIHFYGMSNYEDAVFALPIYKEEAPPAVHFFGLANPDTNIPAGQPVQLKWSTTNAAKVKLEYTDADGNLVVHQSNEPDSPLKLNESAYTLKNKLNPAGNTTISFYAFDKKGNVVGASHQVTVTMIAPKLNIDFDISDSELKIQGNVNNPNIFISITPRQSIESVQLTVNDTDLPPLTSRDSSDWSFSNNYKSLLGKELDGGPNTFKLTVKEKGRPVITQTKTYWGRLPVKAKGGTDSYEVKAFRGPKLLWMTQNLATDVGTGCWPPKSYIKSYVCDPGLYYTLEAAKNACPTGWRLPYLDEWKELVKEYGYDQLINSPDGSTSQIKGNSGFNVMFGGFWDSSSNKFSFEGGLALLPDPLESYFWVQENTSPTLAGSSDLQIFAFTRSNNPQSPGQTGIKNANANNGLSVRYVKEMPDTP